MFESVVFVLLCSLLVLAGGAAIYMGVMKRLCSEMTFGGSVFFSIFSFTLSAVIWFFIYSFHYLGW